MNIQFQHKHERLINRQPGRIQPLGVQQHIHSFSLGRPLTHGLKLRRIVNA